MPALSFADARQCVLAQVGGACAHRHAEHVPLAAAHGRVLACDIRADRDYPPLPRSVRDGFAVRAQDLPGDLHILGEVRAGQTFSGSVIPGTAVEIMTGAPVPAGADAVVMVEHVRVEGGLVHCPQSAAPGDFIDPAGSMCRAGDIVLPPGRRLDAAGIAALATFGIDPAPVCPRPRVAIIATGDELVDVSASPLPHQVRNSNAVSLAAQVTRAGGVAHVLPCAPDTLEATRALIEEGLLFDLLLLSGGVSAGKYDVVENAFRSLDAEFYFDRVLIQPGQPLVFGRCRGTFFFGLPGNPASTMVCFEVFARAALELLSGIAEPSLPLFDAVLTQPLTVRPGLTRFLPAWLDAGPPRVRPVRWQGSGDIAALARANCYLVTSPDRGEYAAGDPIQVLLR